MRNKALSFWGDAESKEYTNKDWATMQSFFSFLSEHDKDLHYLIISQPTTRCLLGLQVRYKTNSCMCLCAELCVLLLLPRGGLAI